MGLNSKPIVSKKKTASLEQKAKTLFPEKLVKIVDTNSKEMIAIQKKLGITSFCEEAENQPKVRRTSFPNMENVNISQPVVWKSNPNFIKEQIKNSMVLKALLSPTKIPLSSSKNKTEEEKKYAAKYGIMEEEEFSDDEDDMLPPSVQTVIAIQQKLGVTAFCEEYDRPRTFKRSNSFPSVLDS